MKGILEVKLPTVWTHEKAEVGRAREAERRKKIREEKESSRTLAQSGRLACQPKSENRNFTSVFNDRASFRAKRLQPKFENRKFTSVFDDQTPLRAKLEKRDGTWLPMLRTDCFAQE